MPPQFNRPDQSPQVDPSTLSNYSRFELGETKLDFEVDFDRKIVRGRVVYALTTKTSGVDKVVLDTSFLVIHSAQIDDAAAEFELADRKAPLGSALTVRVPNSTKSSFQLAVEFETTQKCTALQFLDKEATDGKLKPYLFSQCQAIHARSLFPCFDTPSTKSPFKFSVKSPYPSLMSGRPVESSKNDLGTYYFNQPIPIPSYLVSLASGDITKLPIGPRSHVYAEPSRVNACQHEFSHDMEPFLQTAEKLVLPYEWDTYDALVLPSSFPYGGMENPNITFATPTLISGDRANVDVIAHELAHSWSGNLVTNCSWEHFWLNEGWTVYLERRIQGAIHGEATRHFSAIIGWSDLEHSIKAMGKSASRYSTLVQNLTSEGDDPDDAFSSVPYEKGFNLLYHIETILGQPKFNQFIPHYFSLYKYRSLDTYQFLDTLYDFFKDDADKLDQIDWQRWLFEPGMPPYDPKFDTTLVDQVYALADQWYLATTQSPDSIPNKFGVSDVTNFTPNQSVVFLDTLNSFNKKDDFKWSQHKSALQQLTSIYGEVYNQQTNCEVIFRWFALQVGGHNESFYTKLGEWLGTVGRMKFVRPGYVLLNQVDHDLAIRYFTRFENGYHPICKAMVKKDLGIN